MCCWYMERQFILVFCHRQIYCCYCWHYYLATNDNNDSLLIQSPECSWKLLVRPILSAEHWQAVKQ
jgi:hypothetical protein